MTFMPAEIPCTIIDATELDDLVLWVTIADLDKGQLCNRDQVEGFLSAFGRDWERHTESFSDPQLTEEKAEFAVVYSVQLAESKRQSAFLYFTQSTAELHLPESSLLSKELLICRKKYSAWRALADGIETAANFRWRHAEFAGTVIEYQRGDDFWRKYCSSFFSRVEWD